MRRQSGFTLIELMTAIALLSVLSIAVMKSVSGQRTQQQLQVTSEQMTAIARIASDYRRLRDSSGNYVANREVSIATLNAHFDSSLAVHNPWGVPYEISIRPTGGVVRTEVPLDVAPSGFRVTAIGGDRTRLAKQYGGESDSPLTRRIRLIKAQIYEETSR